MREETKIVYISIDNIIFESKEECEKHEKRLKNVKYFLVRHSPDLTEGRGLKEQKLLAVHSKSNHEEFARHFCYMLFGPEYAFAMSHYGSNALVKNWAIYKLTLEEIGSLDAKIDYCLETADVADNYIWNDSIRSVSNIREMIERQGM